jgi:hypothetical protein
MSAATAGPSASSAAPRGAGGRICRTACSSNRRAAPPACRTGGCLQAEAHCDQYGLSCGDYGVPVPLETFTDCGLKFQQRFVPGVEDTQVLALHRLTATSCKPPLARCLQGKAWSSSSGSAISGMFRSGWLICPESWSRTHRTMVPLQPASYRLPQALHVVILSWPFSAKVLSDNSRRRPPPPVRQPKADPLAGHCGPREAGSPVVRP